MLLTVTHLLLTVVGLLLVSSAVEGTVYWDKCQVEADHPEQVNGNYFNLCVKEEEIEDRAHSWMFTDATIQDTTFTNCIFINKKNAPNNFTFANWRDVTFDGCYFGSQDFYGPFMTFDHTVMSGVTFRNTVFDHTVSTIFDNFEMNDVVFDNCTFKGNIVFRSGTINKLHITKSLFVHNPDTMKKTENESLYFQRCSINTLTTLDNEFVNPVRFEGVDAEDVSFNESKLNEFYCHGPEDKNGDITLRSEFTSGVWDNCEFGGAVVCDETTWMGFYGANLTFLSDADFSKSKIENIYWDRIHSVVNSGQEMTTLNFSESKLTRQTFANISIDGRASFEQTQFTKVRVKNFYAKKPNFDSAVFHEQEFIDGRCCSQACGPLKCRCNVTEPSGLCPTVGHPVNISAIVLTCFPADSLVRIPINGDNNMNINKHNKIRMDELQFGDHVQISHDQHSDVYFFGHRLDNVMLQYTRIHYYHSPTATTKHLRMSAEHYLYVNGRLQTAGSVKVGDRLRSADDGTDSLLVEKIDSVVAKGAYAPTTLHGDVIVDDVVVSSYTDAVHPATAHRLLTPLRGLYRAGLYQVVERMKMFEQHSWHHVARTLGFARGPSVVVAE